MKTLLVVSGVLVALVIYIPPFLFGVVSGIGAPRLQPFRKSALEGLDLWVLFSRPFDGNQEIRVRALLAFILLVTIVAAIPGSMLGAIYVKIGGLYRRTCIRIKRWRQR